MGDPVGVAVIGTGSIADAHLYAYQRLGDRARLRAVADIDPARAASAAERFGAESTAGDYRDVLARDDVQVVSICTPPFLHVEIAAAALRAGKHVLCEKPVSHTLAGIDEIAEAGREGGGVFSGVFQLRFGRGAQQVRALIDEGRFGRLHLGLAETLWFRDQPYFDDIAWHGAWATEGGGVTVSQAIHVIDTLIWFLGEPAHVYAEAGTFRARIEVEDDSLAVVRFKNGAIAQFTCTSSSLAEQRSLIELHGTELTAVSRGPVYDSTVEPFLLSSVDPEYAMNVQREMDERMPKGYRVLHRGCVADLLDAVEAGRAPLVDIEACRTVAQVTTAMYKSAMTGERVDLPITKDDPFYTAMPPDGFALPG